MLLNNRPRCLLYVSTNKLLEYYKLSNCDTQDRYPDTGRTYLIYRVFHLNKTEPIVDELAKNFVGVMTVLDHVLDDGPIIQNLPKQLDSGDRPFAST